MIYQHIILLNIAKGELYHISTSVYIRLHVLKILFINQKLISAKLRFEHHQS